MSDPTPSPVRNRIHWLLTGRGRLAIALLAGAFLAELGKLLLMFFAGLNIDLALFRRARNRSIAFGVATTMLPLVLGTAVGLAFGYDAIPAVVIGSLLASHTMLGTALTGAGNSCRRSCDKRYCKQQGRQFSRTCHGLNNMQST